MYRAATVALSISLFTIACERAPVLATQVEAGQTEVATAGLKVLRADPRKFRPGVRTYSHCDIWGCTSCAGTVCPPPQAASIIHCCNGDGICVHIQLMSDCDPADYLVICNYGQSNVDGTITCYE